MRMETYYDVGFSSTVSSKKVVMIFVKLSMPKVEKRNVKVFSKFLATKFSFINQLQFHLRVPLSLYFFY